jgi:hypothetical protein
MDQFQFEINPTEIIPFDEFSVNVEFTYLYVFHADKTPPHLGLVVNGLFYSIKAKGLDLDLAPEKINALIHRKNICTLVFKLKFNTDADIKELFSSYGKHIQTGLTCLTPISKVIYGKAKHEKIGQLLCDLSDDNKIKSIYSAYLPNDFKGIRNYSVQDINQRIALLKNEQ